VAAQDEDGALNPLDCDRRDLLEALLSTV